MYDCWPKLHIRRVTVCEDCVVMPGTVGTLSPSDSDPVGHVGTLSPSDSDSWRRSQ